MSRIANTFLVQLLLVCVCLWSTTASAGTKNNERAFYSKLDSVYLIELKGRRYDMAHDPVSLLMHKSHTEYYEIIVPRIDGTIDASEIPVRPGYYRYEGSIVIAKKRMKMNLSYQNTDDKRLEPLSWNGTYVLSQKKAPSEQELAMLKTALSSKDRSVAIAAARELMTMGREGRATVYEALINTPSLGESLSLWLSSMHIGEEEKVQRWKEDIPDFVKLAESNDVEVMLIGLSLLSCTDEGKVKIREFGAKHPDKKGFSDIYLN